MYYIEHTLGALQLLWRAERCGLPADRRPHANTISSSRVGQQDSLPEAQPKVLSNGPGAQVQRLRDDRIALGTRNARALDRVLPGAREIGRS
jgi:hypothetical protein